MIRIYNQAAIGALAMLLLSSSATLAAVQAVDPIPEPAGLALLAVAIGGAAWLKFRHRKK